MTENPAFSPRDPAAPTIDHEPASSVQQRPVQARRGGAGGTLFTLFLFLLLAGGLYYVWVNPRPPDESDAAGALQRQVEAQAQTLSRQTAQLQGFGQQVQTLTDRVDKLEKALGSVQAPAAADLGNLPQRVDELAAKVAALGSQPAAPAADLGDLPQRVDALSAKVAALSGQPAAAAADLGDLPQKVDALSARVAALASQPAPAPVDLAPVQQALAALTQRVEQVQASDQEAIGQVQARQKDAVDQVQSAVLAQQKSAIGQVDARLSKLEQGAGTVEDAASRTARLERIQAAVVALQAGQKLGTIPGAPPELARFANQAPPTEAALRESFPALAAHARAVSQPDLAHRSFLQRTLARLQQSVTVRQGDDVLVGDPAAGVISDAELKVQNGDLAGAVQRLGALRGPAAVAMAGWVDQARALVAARAALANLAERG